MCIDFLPDGRLLIVSSADRQVLRREPDGELVRHAESYAEQLTASDVAPDGQLSGRRVWAATPGDHPDGICIDATGAVRYADVGRRHRVRVREGGEVIAAVDFDRGAIACALSRGDDPKLFVIGQNWGGLDAVSFTRARTRPAADTSSR